MALGPADVDLVLAEVTAGGLADGLVVVRAHGHPDAGTAELVGLDDRGGSWRVTTAAGDETAEDVVRIGWRGGPVHDVASLRDALAALHAVALGAERASLAMGQHGALRYAPPVDVRPWERLPGQ